MAETSGRNPSSGYLAYSCRMASIIAAAWAMKSGSTILAPVPSPAITDRWSDMERWTRRFGKRSANREGAVKRAAGPEFDLLLAERLPDLVFPPESSIDRATWELSIRTRMSTNASLVSVNAGHTLRRSVRCRAIRRKGSRRERRKMFDDAIHYPWYDYLKVFDAK